MTKRPIGPAFSASRSPAIALQRPWARSETLLNRIFSVVRSMTEKIVELSRGVVTPAGYGESKR